jgi:hypothetical protein
MASVQLDLKEIGPNKWQLHSLKGFTIGPIFRGKKFEAVEWATEYCSTWPNWSINYEGKNETKRLP